MTPPSSAAHVRSEREPVKIGLVNWAIGSLVEGLGVSWGMVPFEGRQAEEFTGGHHDDACLGGPGARYGGVTAVVVLSDEHKTRCLGNMGDCLASSKSKFVERGPNPNPCSDVPSTCNHSSSSSPGQSLLFKIKNSTSATVIRITRTTIATTSLLSPILPPFPRLKIHGLLRRKL